MGFIIQPTNGICVEPQHHSVTLARAWPDDPDRPNDFVFRYDGRNVGRAFKVLISAGPRWQWSIHIYARVKRVKGVPISGYGISLEDAAEQFKNTFARMFDAGVSSGT